MRYAAKNALVKRKRFLQETDLAFLLLLLSSFDSVLLILEQIVERPQRKQITPVAVVESSRRPICMGAVMVDIFKRQLFVNLIVGDTITRYDYTVYWISGLEFVI